MGDIGMLFPDNDPAYKGADSIMLLREVVRRVREAGFEPVNVDATILAQAPRLSPHKQQMRQNLADAADLDISQVSVKATTEEGLGWTGSSEGMAVHALALLTKK